MKKISSLIIALILTACGGGGGGDEPQVVVPKTPEVQEPTTSSPTESVTEDSPDPNQPVVSLSATAPYDNLDAELASLTQASTTKSFFCSNTGAGSQITGTVSKVHDGDTITVNGYSIRLDSIDAPELSQAYGTQSRDTLASLVKDQTVTVVYAKKDKYGRIVGTVYKNDCTQVNLQQVAIGSAWYYEAYRCEISTSMRNAYANAQSSAQSNDLGLWEFSAIAPWVYRNGQEAVVPESCENGDEPYWGSVATSPVATTPPITGGNTGIVTPIKTCQARIWVNAYTRKDGTRVKGHWRNNPNC